MSCPILHTLVNEGWLSPDKEGWVSCSELYDAMRRLGLDPATSNSLVKAARINGGDDEGRVNLPRVLQGQLRHDADFYRKERLRDLMGEQRFISAEDLAQAAQKRLEEEPGLHGRIQGGAELIAMLTVFGTERDGRLVLSREDLERLFIDNRFPRGWEPRSYRTLEAPLETARYAFNQALDEFPRLPQER